MGITEFVAEWGTRIVASAGYPGVLFLMFLESMIPPIPGEAIMPFVGFLIAEGSMSAPAAVGIATLGSLLGALAFYALGRFGGRPLVRRYGQFVRLDESALDRAEAFFRRRGGITILIGRFVPVVRPLLALPAGAARMRLSTFCLFTVLGAGIWNAFLAGCGVLLRQNWATVLRYSKWLDLAAIVVVAAVVVWLVVRAVRKRRVPPSRRGS